MRLCKGLREQGPADKAQEYAVVFVGFLAPTQAAVLGGSD